jgi:ribonuclease P protein component
MIPPTRNTLCKEERLNRQKIIERLNGDGAALRTPALILVYLPARLPSDFPAQVMFTVGKRNFKRAHDRNRIKRLMREGYRKQKHIVYKPLRERNLQCALMIIFTGRTLPNAAYVHGKISELLKRFVDIIPQIPEHANIQE